MKKIILIISLVCSTTFGASVTNKIVNTITITSTNSPVEIGFYLTAGATMAATASPQPFTHGLVNYNPSNPTAFVRNTAPDGISGFWFKNSLGTDVGAVAFINNTSNLTIHNFISGKPVRIIAGSATAQLLIHETVVTNDGPLVVTGTATFLGGVNMGSNPGITLSVTNLGPTLGSSNVMVYASGILTNKFTIP